MEVVFWSPARGGQTTRNMKILANIYRIRYGMQVRTFENYEAYGKYHFMENMQKQNRQKKKGHGTPLNESARFSSFSRRFT